ncbi:polyprenyl synthetase family protein [Miniphocaeibacter massiliensis]|uniref:polyprenyl synthetase family protein n=1 Tax=Miniphocaeibacter massiliensis TaxID=2041841 RepID=UPI000C0738F1|nr:polyprenyl synthetase family protein [Miniphocaeibacter massiliensis]
MKKFNDFKVELNKKQNDLNEKLSRIFNGNDILSSASNYALTIGGKRLRPVLLMEFASLFTEVTDYIYNFAISLELIHNYSLIHDDLPSMDDDEFRRGNLTVHKKYGEDIAVLAGDNLLNKSYEIIFDTMATNNLDRKYIFAASYLSKISGQEGMIGGQIADITNKFESMNDILDMYVKKTCGLIKIACKVGAILGNATEKEVSLSEEFGEVLGLAFQIQDDILDYEEDKNIGKITIANYTSLEESEILVRNYSNRAKEILVELKKDTSFLEELVDYLITRKY